MKEASRRFQPSPRQRRQERRQSCLLQAPRVSLHSFSEFLVITLRSQREEAIRRRLAAQFSPSTHCHFPPPLAPASIIRSAFSTPNVPDTWLGGYSLNVTRNCPTMAALGINVHSLSPHQRAYIIDCSWSRSHGSCRRLVTRGTLVDSS